MSAGFWTHCGCWKVRTPRTCDVDGRADMLLESWTELDQIPVSKTCRVMRLLDLRAFELKSDVHEVFERVWNGLVQVDLECGKVSIYDKREGM